MERVNAGSAISSISAGFPSPADDFTELSISLDKHLIQHPAATFMAYANGNSMLHAGIHHNDILIIDRSLNARNGDIIIPNLHTEILPDDELLLFTKDENITKAENLFL